MKKQNETEELLPPLRGLWFFVSFLIIVSDQLSKWAITELVFRSHLGQTGLGFFEWYTTIPEKIEHAMLPITSFFNLVMVWNTGVSFGMMGEHGANMPMILIGLSGVITLFFLTWMLKTRDNLQGFCFALIIGGAIGNIIDRARFGAVIDYLDFHAFGYHWPAFNVADMSVVGGVCLLVILSITFDFFGKNATPEDAS